MRIGLAATGVVLLIVGILVVLFFWPVIAYETKETLTPENIRGGETIRYVGEITGITENGGIYVLELDNGVLEAYTDEESFILNDEVLVTIEFGNNHTNWDENHYLVQRIPTTEGYLGLIAVILGLIVATAGFIARKSSVEDLVQFNVQPIVQPGFDKQSQASDHLHPHFSEASSTTSNASAMAPQGSPIEQVTCPQCNTIFGVKGHSRPAKISCPECGLEGVSE